ncbi:MAG: methionyl-tRNA formyltransferase [Fodinibius sp.]|nr:methionyl-tRNA formyltransferase [Fodinibius sp.]
MGILLLLSHWPGSELSRYSEGNPRAGRLKKFLDNLDVSVDLILSINYLFLLEQDIIEYPKHYCLNIHGSLLPKYRGRTPHVWAIINNESVAGITMHIIDEGCDTGPIVGQTEIDIPPDMTGGELLEQYRHQYPDLIRTVIAKLERDELAPKSQEESKATYFGKRTPADGEINWNWHKERIRNWVRAQADPYPGAFTYVGGKKITIDEVQYSDRGFSWDTANGFRFWKRHQVPLVKVPNGVLALNIVP